MYKKIFGVVLILHLIAFAYLGLRSGNPNPEAGQNEISDARPTDASQRGDTVEDDLLEEIAPEPEAVAPQIIEFSQALNESLPVNINPEGLESGILFDATANRVIWEKNSQQPIRIASMTKMMTALLAFEDEAKRDDLSMDTIIKVSNAAYRIGGSQVWLDPRESFSLEELLITIMVKSANDSSYLVGEYLANGKMDQFIARMNTRATELSMTQTEFLNAHGLPEGETGNTASCQDLVRLALALYRFDSALEWASIPNYKFRSEAEEPTILANHNRLVLTTPGVNGLKTGYTKAAGFCVTATCERDGRILIAVTTGFPSSKRRDSFTEALLEWGYSQ
jgi:D-alanyl-D-alanine carboxypeptidase (penicillin-binding protein 5/6)